MVLNNKAIILKYFLTIYHTEKFSGEKNSIVKVSNGNMYLVDYLYR